MGLGHPLALKLELTQRTGSFKLRGAFNALLSADPPEAGIVAASGGNFGVAAATAAQDLGIPAAIFVPESAPPAKVERLRRTAADVHLTGALYDDAFAASHEHATATGALEVHAFDDPAIVAGQGTCGRELDLDGPAVDTVLSAWAAAASAPAPPRGSPITRAWSRSSPSPRRHTRRRWPPARRSRSR